MRITTAIILAGGLGTRLRAVLNDRPKVLAPAAGNPFLHYILSYLASQGIQEVILSVGYLADQVIAFAGSRLPRGIRVRTIQETSPLGTGGAARLASSGLVEPFLIVNGDTLFLIDLPSLEKKHQQSGALATVGLRYMADLSVRGRVEMDDAGMIRMFHEKAQSQEAALGNGGVYLFEPGTLDRIPDGEPASLEADLFPALAREGRLAGYVQDAYFCDIGTPESLEAFEADLNSGKLVIV